MTESNEFSGIENRLGEAFKAHAESVQPSPDAYARLAHAVRRHDDSFLHRWGFESYFRPLGFVAAAAVAFGFGGYFLSLQGPQAVESATVAPAVVDPAEMLDESGFEPDATIDFDAEEAASSTDAGNPDSFRAGSGAADLVDDPGATPSTVARAERIESVEQQFEGMTYSPVGETRVAAAENFLALLGVTDVEIIERDSDGDGESDRASQVDVRSSADSGGDNDILTTLVVAPIGKAFVVQEAVSSEHAFDLINASEGDLTADGIGDPITITDAGAVKLTDTSSRSHTITFVAASPTLTRFVNRRVAVGGSKSLGAARIWVVVSSDDDRAANSPFSAKPAYLVGRDDKTAYTVVDLPPDDDDGGLVLRSEPAGKEIGVIRLGTTGVERRTIAPRLANDRTWWAVTTPNGIQGWVASEYLAPNDPIDAATLSAIGNQLRAIVTGQPGAQGQAEYGYPVYVGSLNQPHEVQRGLDALATWETVRDFDNKDVEGTLSLAEFYRADRWTDGEVLIPDGYLDPDASRAANAYFGALPSVAIESINPDTGGRERVHAFVSNQQGDGGDQRSIVGIVLERGPVDEAADDTDESESSGPATTIAPDSDGTDPVDRDGDPEPD